MASEMPEKHPSGAKAHAHFAVYGTAKQAAEKPGPKGGGGFNPRIKPAESIGPSGPEGCFSGFSLIISPISAACKAVPFQSN
jgi:hypothetical protein